MDPLILTIVMRAIERLLVVAGGGLAIYLGFRLFLDMPQAERGTGKINLPGGISIYLSRVGPGVFFSLFGATVIGLSFHYGISFTDRDLSYVGVDQVAAGGAAGDAAGGSARSWTGMTQAGGAPAIEPLERSRVISVVAALNRFERVLPADMKATDRINLQYALRDARQRLLISVWDAESWGDAAAFSDWIKANEPDPPAPEIAEAVRLYRQGRAGAAP